MQGDRPSAGRRNAQRIGWFIALWCAGVAATGIVAYAIRLAIGA